MQGIVLTLMVTGVLGAAIPDSVAQEPAQVVSFHFASMRGLRTGVVTMRTVRVMTGAVQIEAEEAELSMADGRLRLVLQGGGNVMLPQGAQVEVVTGPYDRMQRDEGLTRMLQTLVLFRTPPPRPVLMLSRR